MESVAGSVARDTSPLPHVALPAHPTNPGSLLSVFHDPTIEAHRNLPRQQQNLLTYMDAVARFGAAKSRFFQQHNLECDLRKFPILENFLNLDAEKRGR